MTVSSVIRFNVTKSNDNTTTICETKNDAQDVGSRDSILLVVHYAPVVKITTQPGTIYEGDKVTFTCSASSNPAVKSFLWFVNNIPLMGSQSDTHVIESIGREQHEVKIKCQARNLEGKTGDKTVKPKVNYKPVFTETPVDVSDDKGKVVKLPCVANGFPAPSYIWYRNGDLNTVVGDTSSLEVTIDESTIGKYNCRVSVKGFPEIETSATIYMKGPPQIRNKASQASQIGKEGDTVELVCESFAIPPPTKVIWFVGGKEIDASSQKYSISQTAKADGVISTVTVINSVHDDYTDYKCSIENSYGSDEATFTLVKEEVPSIILPVITGIIIVSVLLLSATITVLYCIRVRRVKDDLSEETDSTSDLGSEMSEASGYTIDSSESQTLSEPFSSAMSRSGMSDESYHPRVPQPKRPARGVISPNPYFRDIVSPPLPSPPPPMPPPAPPRRAISPLPMSRGRIAAQTTSYFQQKTRTIIPSDDLATMV